MRSKTKNGVVEMGKREVEDISGYIAGLNLVLLFFLVMLNGASVRQ